MVQHYSQKKSIRLIFSKSRKKICFSLHYNGANSFLFVNGKEIFKFKAKDAKIVATLLCLDL